MKRKVQKPLVLDDDRPFSFSEQTMTDRFHVHGASDVGDLRSPSPPEEDAAAMDIPSPQEPSPERPPAEEPRPAPAAASSSPTFAGEVARATRPFTPSADKPIRILPPPPPEKGSRVTYAVAAVATLLWAGVPLAFFSGYANGLEPFTFQPLTIALLAAWAVGSIGILWVAARMLTQSLRLGAEVRYARAQAEEMLAPAAMAAAGAGSAVQVVRNEIDNAVNAASQARHELMTLREVLASETAKLVEAAQASARTVQDLTGAVGHERDELGRLTQTLGVQVVEVENAITRQARMVAEASDLAEVQIREAEAALAARASDLAAAANDATDAARVASEDLARQAAKLESAGIGVSDQVKIVEEGLAEQRAALVSVAVSLRAEQEDFAAQVESQQAQLSEILAQTRAASQDVSEATGASAESLRQLISQAADQYREVAEATHEERDLFGATTLQALGALSEAARNERQLLTDETEAAIQRLADATARVQASTEAQTQAAQARIDALGEASFAAGQKADAAFEARLNEARALIEQSADLIEEAGQRTNERIIQSLDAARGTVAQLEGLLEEVDARVAALPAGAQRQSQEIRAVVEQGVEELLGAARRAADETQAIDAAFQERVKRNYEMLSEAVRMMGVVGGTAATTSRTPRTPVRAPSPPAQTPAPAVQVEAARPAAPALAEEAGLRPRLKLTAPPPVASDQDFHSVFEAAAPSAAPSPPPPPPPVRDPEPLLSLRPTVDTDLGPPERPPAGGEDWTWKELLSDIGEPASAPRAEPAPFAATSPQPASRAAPQVGTRMASEISNLGIDPLALLPRQRTDEVAAILQAGDIHGARDVVRRAAPAAMRRLSRRVLMDPTLNANASQFIRDYEAVVDDAAVADPQGRALADLLGTDQGRAYLLLDGALGDVG